MATRWLTVRETATLVHRSARQVQRACRSAELHAQQESTGQWRVSYACLRPWLLGRLCPHLEAAVTASRAAG